MGTREILLAPIQDKLAALEQEFEQRLASPIPIIAEINRYIASHSGKRIRPTLLLLVSRMLGYPGRADVTFAAVVEFIHTATLIHDDIIDNAAVRRGQKSVNALWGSNVTVLLGDYLYLKSMELALTAESLSALAVLTEATIEMIEGELIQLDKKGALELTREEYLDIIRRKTSALFSGSCRIAALLAQADDGQSAALATYGRSIGMAFQIVDDLLDFVGTEEELGKSVLSDLREGRVTLPIVELVERAPRAELAPVEQILRSGVVADGDHARILALLERHGTLASSSALAHELAKEARKSLALFPDSDAKRVLEMVPDYIVSRTR